MKHGQRGQVDIIGTACSAWISPAGEYYYTGECGHWEAAATILGDARDVYADPVDTLESRGWLHLSYGNIIMHEFRRPTSAQVAALQDAVSHVIMSGMISRYQRELVTQASYYC